MSLWVEQKYIHLISSRLDKFKKKSNNTYNFRCPICLDSQTNKNKSRGYLFEIKNSYQFYCHNCGEKQSFQYFLKSLDYNLYNQFLLDSLVDEGKPIDSIKPRKTTSNDITINLKTIDMLPYKHLAKQYLVDRKIPKEYFKELYYTDNYMHWVNGILPNKFSKDSLKYDAPRVVIPFLNTDGTVFGVQGRALDPRDKIRYSTAIFKELNHRLYGMHRINFNKRYYVLEGPFDSMFIDNCLAAGTSDLDSSIIRLGVNINNAVFISDNQPRNPEIVKTVRKYVNKNYNVVIWPSDTEFKDINEAIKDYSYNSSEIMTLIEQRTYSGLTAQIKFNEWSKI